jgi:hypothetical protein
MPNRFTDSGPSRSACPTAKAAPSWLASVRQPGRAMQWPRRMSRPSTSDGTFTYRSWTGRGLHGTWSLANLMCRPRFLECRAQVRVLSGAPTTTETALTSGYLLVETRSPLPEPTRRRRERQGLVGQQLPPKRGAELAPSCGALCSPCHVVARGDAPPATPPSPARPSGGSSVPTRRNPPHGQQAMAASR